MKKYALILILILLVAVMGGCISSGGGSSSTSRVTSSGTQGSTTTSGTSQSSTTSSPTETTSTTTPQTPSPGQWLSGIHQVEYTSNVTLDLNVTVTQGNFSQTDKLQLRILKSTYLDFKEKNGIINTTTTSLSDGTSSTTNTVIIHGEVYTKTLSGWLRVNDSTMSELIWGYNIISLAKRYVNRTPLQKSEDNGLTLVYRISSEDLLKMAVTYFSPTSSAELNVSNGVLELHFVSGELKWGRISYDASSEAEVSDPTMGNMTIVQKGRWEEVITITGINQRIKVEKP